MWGIVGYVARVNEKWREDEKKRNLESCKLEKFSYALVKRHCLSSMVEKNKSLNIETVIFIVKKVGNKDPPCTVATRSTSALLRDYF